MAASSAGQATGIVTEIVGVVTVDVVKITVEVEAAAKTTAGAVVVVAEAMTASNGATLEGNKSENHSKIRDGKSACAAFPFFFCTKFKP